MALNCVLLAHQNPIPIPEEKILLSVSSMQLHLSPKLPRNATSPAIPNAKPYSADGTIYISNRRIIFVSETATETETAATTSASAVSIPTETVLDTFTAPISHIQNSRFQQPIFKAMYLEADVLPVASGGLVCIYEIKISFKNGKGWEFYEILEEMKAREGETTTVVAEELPRYEPRATLSENQENINARDNFQAAAIASHYEGAEHGRDCEEAGDPPEYS